MLSIFKIAALLGASTAAQEIFRLSDELANSRELRRGRCPYPLVPPAAFPRDYTPVCNQADLNGALGGPS